MPPSKTIDSKKKKKSILLTGFKWTKRYQKQSKENGAHKIILEVTEAHT